MAKEQAKFDKINKEKQRVAEEAREQKVKELKNETLRSAAGQKNVITIVAGHMEAEYNKLVAAKNAATNAG
jgi:hypothetical protein